MAKKGNTELILSYLKKYSEMGNKALADLILSEHDLGTTAESLRVSIYSTRINHAEELSVLLEDDTKWTVENGNYNWQAKRGVINLPVDFIDQLFYEYSEHGLNLSSTEIINKYDLKIWQWHSIKNTLQLYKKANIFSPYTVEQTKPEDLQLMIEGKMQKMFSSVGYQVEKTYDKLLKKEYKRAINKEAERDLQQQIILTELYDLIPKALVQIKPTIRIQPNANGTLCVFIFDVHFGAESRTKYLAPYSPEITEAQFKEIADEINSYGAKEVHLFFGGDNIETGTGLNHLDSWKGIAKGYYGSQLIIKGYRVFTNFISSVDNVKKIYAVPGNHDRMTANKNEDGEGFLAEILFEMIRLTLDNQIEVEYNEKVISAKIDGINYIMSHGHFKLSDMNPAEMVLEYGDPHSFNLIVSGHWHSRKVKKDGRNFRQIVCPSIFPGNDYSQNLGVNSAPGVTLVQSKNNLPKIIDCPL